ncbi:MAG: heat-inducible transcriptional repressor HrcA [Cyanobacteria bacterium P01_A01_bin.135]
MQIKLNKRQQHVMWATVRRYVTTAKPVGSEALLEEFNLNVSSATVRNAMGRLEKAGLLYQPHTSAGRVPSDLGYRIYVDHLLKPSMMGSQLEQLFASQLQGDRRSLEALLRGAAQLLSQLSGYVALITLPERSEATLRHLQLVPIEGHRVLMIVVMDTYESESVVIDLPVLGDDSSDSAIDPEILEQELQILSNFLNHRLRGQALSDIGTVDWGELGQELERHANILSAALVELERSKRPEASHILFSGLSEVLRRHPEFSEREQLQTLVQLLEEEQDLLLPMLTAGDAVDPSAMTPTINIDLPQRRVAVRIGSENSLQPIQDCALVFTTYQCGDAAQGSVGLLGPTRMMYEDAIAAVEATANHLSEVIASALMTTASV